VIERNGGPDRTRICDLYRVKVANGSEDQQDDPQVADFAFGGMGQSGTKVTAMGQNGLLVLLILRRVNLGANNLRHRSDNDLRIPTAQVAEPLHTDSH
jgi:hypothetical protein